MSYVIPSIHSIRKVLRIFHHVNFTDLQDKIIAHDRMILRFITSYLQLVSASRPQIGVCSPRLVHLDLPPGRGGFLCTISTNSLMILPNFQPCRAVEALVEQKRQKPHQTLHARNKNHAHIAESAVIFCQVREER